MYTLTHDGDDIGTTKLESGDPSTYAVSGAFTNFGGAKALAGWIKSIGGEEDDGVVFIALNEDFTLLDQAGEIVKFTEGSLIAVPDESEVYLDISGLSEADYKAYFAEHVLAMESKSWGLNWAKLNLLAIYFYDNLNLILFVNCSLTLRELYLKRSIICQQPK